MAERLSLGQVFARVRGRTIEEKKEKEREEEEEYLRRKTAAKLRRRAFEVWFDYGKERQETTGASSGKPDVIGFWLEPVDLFLTPPVYLPLDGNNKDEQVGPFWLEGKAGGEKISLKTLVGGEEVNFFVMKGDDCWNWRGDLATTKEMEFVESKVVADMEKALADSVEGRETENNGDPFHGLELER